VPAISSKISHVAGFRLATLTSTQLHAVVNTNLQKRFYTTLTDDKQKEIKDNNIDMFIDNEIEQINSVKNSAVCCLLLKEKYNYCWESNRLLGSKETVKMID
jgi:hypothetical protein